MTSAPEIAARLGLKRAGRGWQGACPCCGYASGLRLSEKDGRALWWCASCRDRGALSAAVLGQSEPVTPRWRFGMMPCRRKHRPSKPICNIGRLPCNRARPGKIGFTNTISDGRYRAGLLRPQRPKRSGQPRTKPSTAGSLTDPRHCMIYQVTPKWPQDPSTHCRDC
jgi:hypothetical protein